MNKRTLFHWNVGNTFQNGLLSTPFHRVYFNDTTISGLEVLPYHRFKLPISLGVNFFAFHNLILKPKYRLYFDTFGIISNTISLKAILKLNPYFSLHGTYRYAYQKGSNYFREHAEHSSSDVYKTSDYDLSTFSSFYYNLGIRYSPLSPILSIKRFSLNKVEIRYANFRRSNDLKSNLISGALSFSLKRK